MTRRGFAYDNARYVEGALVSALIYTRGLQIDGSGGKWKVVNRVLEPDMFADPFWGAAFAAVRDLKERGEPVDALNVAALLQRDGVADKPLDRIVASFSEFDVTAAAVVVNAERVHEYWARRRMLTIAGELSDDADDPTVNVFDVLDRTGRALAEIPPLRGTREPESVTADDLLAGVSDDSAQDWIIPQLLERRERLMIVAGEGTGKSTLLRQIGIAAAHGLHPFTHTPVLPRRVLVVDAENVPAQLARKSAAQIRFAERIAGKTRAGDMIRFLSKPNGMNLINRADRDRLIEEVLASRAELVVIGPLYKLFSWLPAYEGDAEATVKKVAESIDLLINECHCAVVMEHHAPFGEGRDRAMRPFGSTVWQRWPDTGIGLTPEQDGPGFKVTRFREDRDRRNWPGMLFRRADGIPWWSEDPKTASARSPEDEF